MPELRNTLNMPLGVAMVAAAGSLAVTIGPALPPMAIVGISIPTDCMCIYGC